MAIPKNIFQTFKTKKLPAVTRWHISRMQSKNPEWNYFLFDDEDIVNFLTENFSDYEVKAFKSLTIGAAKADFFRYAVLYIKGGLYLDIDSAAPKPLNSWILQEDDFILSPEGNPGLYCQWGLISAPSHIFLKRTIEKMCDNIYSHRYPHDVHRTTGPTVFTEAVSEILQENPTVSYRMLEVDFEGNLIFKYKLGRLFLYGSKAEHWKKKQLSQPIIKFPEE